MNFVSPYSSIALLLLSLFSATVARAQLFSEKSNNYYHIEQLIQNDNDKTYGFTATNPVKVGRNESYGGAFNEHRYLQLLRDEHGDRIIFKRVGTCCAYKSENGFLGNASINQYEINYRDKQGNSKTRLVYISHYDYDQPKLLFGFKSTNQQSLPLLE